MEGKDLFQIFCLFLSFFNFVCKMYFNLLNDGDIEEKVRALN